MCQAVDVAAAVLAIVLECADYGAYLLCELSLSMFFLGSPC